MGRILAFVPAIAVGLFTALAIAQKSNTMGMIAFIAAIGAAGIASWAYQRTYYGGRLAAVIAIAVGVASASAAITGKVFG